MLLDTGRTCKGLDFKSWCKVVLFRSFYQQNNGIVKASSVYMLISCGLVHKFEEQVIKPVTQVFLVGSFETGVFKYLGLDVVSNSDGSTVFQ